ncbi:MAG: PDZ domain-containing protein [Candidatus Melainabacteria bacterium]|nr:PDZ domain-containing protein [Candidatus Melainabacteria bacterium]
MSQNLLIAALSVTLITGCLEPVQASQYSNSPVMEAGDQEAPSGAMGLVVNWNQMGRLMVTQVVPGGPAAGAGVAVGDLLLAVDGENVQGLPADQVFRRIIGEAGTTTTLSLQSPTRGNYQAKITRVSAEELKKSASFNTGWQPAGAGNNNNNNNNSGTASWSTYGSEKDGYSLRYPGGWTVSQDSKTGRLEINSPGKSRLSIFPFFLPASSININQAQGLFSAMLKQYGSGTSWSQPAMVAGALRASSMADNVNSVAGLALSSMNGGTAGRLIIFHVPNNDNAQSELASLAGILQSFTISGGAASAGAGTATDTGDSVGADTGSSNPMAPIEYTKFVDPKEGAFSLDVPAGWSVEGGMERPMSVDLRPWVKAVAPDQKMMIFIGDASIKPRYLPSKTLSWTGFHPGSNYSPGNGLQTRVLYYQKADKFIEDYARSRLAKQCDTFELETMKHLPDLALAINGTAGVVASDAATAKYNFTSKGVQGVAYFLAATKAGKEMWWVSLCSGLLADSSCEKQALEVFTRMYKSWEFNPQWNQAQGRENVRFAQSAIARDRAIRAQLTRDFNARMAAMDARHNAYMDRMRSMDASHQRYMNSMRSSDRAHSDFINYIRDEDTLVDPGTGTQYQVEFGPKYHWVNNTGDRVLSTDSAWSPGVDWTELVAPPR